MKGFGAVRVQFVVASEHVFLLSDSRVATCGSTINLEQMQFSHFTTSKRGALTIFSQREPLDPVRMTVSAANDANSTYQNDPLDVPRENVYRPPA
mmetsp:Transcript_9927/g.20520  ORF Transcript_9927/g.20520 Transcript_9927/m.20520 type:complete len:95 (-) Transcript_9927:668-952(-)